MRRPPPPPDDAGAWDELPPRSGTAVDLHAPEDSDTDPWAAGPAARRGDLDLDAPPDDDVPLELDERQATEPETFDLAEEPVILSWCATARIDGREVAVLLDPTLPRSRWTKPGAAAGGKMVEIQLGGRAFLLELPTVDGPAEELRLGRDALAGRIWVSC